MLQDRAGKRYTASMPTSDRPIIILKPKEDLRIRAGHPWIYDNEIQRVEGFPEPGSEVQIQDARRIAVGMAFWNPSSKIRARLYSRSLRPADRAFFAETFQTALAWRRRFFDPDTQSLRIVFGESDGLPGLIVDSYVGREPASPDGPPRRVISAQFLGMGVAMRKDLILDALQEVFPSDGAFEKSEAPVLALEGIPARTGPLRGEVPQALVMKENGLSFSVDISGGQKTGWFLDQRSNRAAVAAFAKGREVLDLFCNQGGFALACAAAGATGVLAVDSSEEALVRLTANASLNAMGDTVRTAPANAFDFLRAEERSGHKYGLVILDPPAFAKNRASIDAARRGYKDLNLRGMRLLEKGGILATFSCSHWFSAELFDSMLAEAARDSGRRLRTIAERTQDLDHPIVSGYAESRYLKCRILEVG